MISPTSQPRLSRALKQCAKCAKRDRIIVVKRRVVKGRLTMLKPVQAFTHTAPTADTIDMEYQQILMTFVWPDNYRLVVFDTVPVYPEDEDGEGSVFGYQVSSQENRKWL